MRHRDSALQLAAHGWRIIPVLVWYENDKWHKRPLLKDWPNRASATPAVISAWWKNWSDAWVGVPLQPNNLIVIDCDRHGKGQDGVALLAGVELPPHPVDLTISRGEHHLFRQPLNAPRVRSAKWAGGEILADGRWSAVYAVEPFLARVPAWPRDLLERLPKVRVGKRNSETTHARPLLSSSFDPEPTLNTYLRSKSLIRALETARSGNWHCCLYWTSCRHGNMWGEGKIAYEVAEHLLIEAAKANGSWAQDWSHCLATIRDGLWKGKAEWLAWDAGRKRAGGVVSETERRAS